jgi:hypothetical protein
LNASELECIGKGNARAPCAFGCKVSIAALAAAPTPNPPAIMSAAKRLCGVSLAVYLTDCLKLRSLSRALNGKSMFQQNAGSKADEYIEKGHSRLP